MKFSNRLCLMLCLIFTGSFCRAQQSKAVVKTGENTITLNGERFHNEKIILKPINTGADNLWFDNGKQKFTDINLVGKYDDRSVNFQLRFPGQTGVYTIENNRTSTGSQSNDNNCYLLMTDKDTYGDAPGGVPGSVTVTVTRYDKPGGLLEGAISGELMTGNRNNIPISISGNFSVVRAKDSKGF